ncbi:MAG: hypothetical protein ACFNLH_08640, partial [Corynebacterium matruchotii]
PALTTAQRIRATVGVAVIFGTWFYLVFTRPSACLCRYIDSEFIVQESPDGRARKHNVALVYP